MLPKSTGNIEITGFSPGGQHVLSNFFPAFKNTQEMAKYRIKNTTLKIVTY
jgi:hypothetical protein